MLYAETCLGNQPELFDQEPPKGVLLHPSFLEDIIPLLKSYKRSFKRKGKTTIYYYDFPASLDLETSSSRSEEDEMQVVTYANGINLDGWCFLLREWSEYTAFIKQLQDGLNLTSDNRVLFFVHNLSYDFQFLKKWTQFMDVFVNGGERNVLTATMKGIEFRCSLMLSGYNLKKLAENLTTYTIKKLEGDVDHKIIHTPLTPLTEKERNYILNDIVIIEYYIREELLDPMNGGKIAKIPLTATGKVRRIVKQNTIGGNEKEHRRYRRLMQELTFEHDELKGLLKAYTGGFTHAAAHTSGKLLKDVTCKDLNSAYPAAVVYGKFPMTKGERYSPIDMRDFHNQLRDHCCLMRIRFHHLECKAVDAYISHSKCNDSLNVVRNNGRVDMADMVDIWITEIDFECILKSYDMSGFDIVDFWRYGKGYLPTLFVESVIDMYAQKTELKGVVGMEAEYKKSKESVNSVYGMCSTNPIRDNYIWNAESFFHDKQGSAFDEALEDYNTSKTRFISFTWGVWITAHTRKEVYLTAVKLDGNHHYADTDSIYFTDKEKNEHVFEERNRAIEQSLRLACEHHGFDFDRVQPMDIKGKRHMLGLWADEGTYDEYKTLGAKRYMKGWKEDGEMVYEMTVSGVNKKEAMPYMYEKFGREGIMEAFTSKLKIPTGRSGKMRHTYIDETRPGMRLEGTVVDYLGQPYQFRERSVVHLEDAAFTMTVGDEYLNFLNSLTS